MVKKQTKKVGKKVNADKTVKVVGFQFQKGNDPRRNLKGRPKGALGFRAYFELALKKLKNRDTNKPMQEDDVTLEYLRRAMGHDNQLLDKLVDRLYGKVPDRIIDETPRDPESRAEVDRLTDQFLNKYKVNE